MEDIMLIRSSFLRRIISQVINKILKKQLPGTEVQLGEVQANWSRKRAEAEDPSGGGRRDDQGTADGYSQEG